MEKEVNASSTQSAFPPQDSAKFLGETYGYWGQTGALFLGAIVALVAIWSARIIERRKSASDVAFKSRQDGELITGLRTISQLHDAPDKNIRQYGKKENSATPEAKTIRYVLNHYEYISVGIQENIYDEHIFKKSIFTTVTRLYERTKPFLDMVRQEEGIPTLYQEFEWLACRWKDKPLKQKKIKGQAN